jgi:hypothetical protein
MADSLTVLTGDKPSAKQVGKGTEGRTEVRQAANSWLHSVETINVGSLNELHSLIDKLQWVPNKFVIRGKLIAGTPIHGIRRLLRPHGDVPASFESAARRWVMLDIDDVSLPETLRDVDAKAEAIIAHSVSLLPEPFRTTACVFQWSGSMGFKKDKIRVHLWFWLDRPLSDDDLKAWLQDSPVDLSLFNPVQVHYTANPILDLGVGDDPIQRRVGLYAPVGSLEEVAVPVDLPAPKNPSSTRPRHHVSTANIVDPQGVTRDRTTGLVIDGRERFMFFKSIDATKELMVGRSNAGDFPTVQQIVDQTWKLFSAEADVSDGKWTQSHALKDAERRYQELEDNTYGYM